MQSPRLHDYLEKLTPGTILGLVNVIYAHSYNTDRSPSPDPTTHRRLCPR